MHGSDVTVDDDGRDDGVFTDDDIATDRAYAWYVTVMLCGFARGMLYASVPSLEAEVSFTLHYVASHYITGVPSFEAEASLQER
jgi:hypothetical protein